MIYIYANFNKENMSITSDTHCSGDSVKVAIAEVIFGIDELIYKLFEHSDGEGEEKTTEDMLDFRNQILQQMMQAPFTYPFGSFVETEESIGPIKQ